MLTAFRTGRQAAAMPLPDPTGAPLPAESPRPTHARIWVVVFAVTLAIIQYIDRVAISQAAPLISADLALSPEQMGWVFSAFTLAYALFEIPGGFLGDRIGPRRVLLRIVVWWSLFTAATGWAWSWLSLLVTRFLFGAGEAGCFPNLAKAFGRWLTRDERARVQGILWTAARWGGAATPMLVFACLQFVSWRTAFLLFGVLGLGWAALFFRWYRDDPRQHRSVNAAEAALLPAGDDPGAGQVHIPWRKLFRSRTVWCLCGQYAALSYAWYFFVTWFPTYLLRERGLDLKQSALLAGTPLLLGGFGALVAGWVSPKLVRRLGPRWGRTGFSAAALLAAGALLIVSTRLQNPYAAVAAIALVSFCNDLTVPGAWTTCMDTGGRFVGTLGGTMNMMGNLGGFLSPIAIGYIIQATNNWTLVFYVTAGVYALGAVFWLLIDPVTPIEKQVAD